MLNTYQCVWIVHHLCGASAIAVLPGYDSPSLLESRNTFFRYLQLMGHTSLISSSTSHIIPGLPPRKIYRCMFSSLDKQNKTGFQICVLRNLRDGTSKGIMNMITDEGKWKKEKYYEVLFTENICLPECKYSAIQHVNAKIVNVFAFCVRNANILGKNARIYIVHP